MTLTSSNEDVQYVLITGCSRGIGLGLVESLLKDPSNSGKYYVIATCRSPNKQHKLRALVSSKPNLATIIKLDVSDEKSIIDSISRISCITKHIDILINNAGRSVSNHPYESVIDFDADEMLNVYKTNVIGMALMVKNYIDLLKSDKNKSSPPAKVINMSSELASLEKAFNGYQEGNENRMTTTSYRLSKCGINMLTRLQAGELGDRYNIIFTALNPGWVKTDLGSANDRIPTTTIKDSVNGIINVVKNMKMETHNGQFMDFNSEIMPF